MLFSKAGWFGLLAANTVAALSFREIQLKAELKMLEESFNLDNGNSRLFQAEPPIYTLNVTLPIDHFAKNKGTFQNRYFVVDEYYKPGGPVFFFDVGEVEDTYAYRGHLQRSTAPWNNYLQKFNAIGILWEHRYYGKSLPFPINLDTTSEQLKYLTTEQALLDSKQFANIFQWANASDVDFHPSKTPWVWYGCSYSGMRAAFARNMYPETFYAAYAGSPPVEARVDMSAYWEQAYRGFVRYNQTQCAKNIQAAVDYIDTQLDHPKKSAAIKQKFLGRGAEKNSNEGFADTLLFPMYNWQAYGIDATLAEFCGNLSLTDSTHTRPVSSLARGKEVAERWAAWPRNIELVNEYVTQAESYCEGPKPAPDGKAPNCKLDERFDSLVGISWTWQYCTEWGFMQTTNWGPNHLGSKYNNLKHQQELCHRQFPDGLKSGLLPVWPRTEQTNRKYGGWTIRPSNTFWTDGEFDPWLTLAPMSKEIYAPKYPLTERIPKCNKKTGRELFGHILPDAQHCYDMRNRATVPQAARPQDLWIEALGEWLSCF